MADKPSLPWDLHCCWCAFYIEVNARGGHGRDQGAGVEAATLMQEHIDTAHSRTWEDFISLTVVGDG